MEKTVRGRRFARFFLPDGSRLTFPAFDGMFSLKSPAPSSLTRGIGTKSVAPVEPETSSGHTGGFFRFMACNDPCPPLAAFMER